MHHALCNIIEPIFERSFIHDSYANRKGKGTLNAVKRFDSFKKKASKNNTLPCHVLKVDIKKYFETVNHNILLSIIKKKIKDKKVIWLVKKIINNRVGGESTSNYKKSMPLGNLTSQFFANIYLNELDQYIKHNLKTKYYIRYVDDFVIVHSDKSILENLKSEINQFLKQVLDIELHPDKSKIILIGNRLTFLGFRMFYHHKLLKKSNLRNMKAKFKFLEKCYEKGKIDYDVIYDFLEGWLAYAEHAETYKLRKKILADSEKRFLGNVSIKEIDRYSKMV